jgi:hypothetical protein
MYNLDIIAVSICLVCCSAFFPISVSLFIYCLGVIGLLYGLWGILMENEERVQLVITNNYQ